ncbi:hypothetical protein IJ818_07125 [bacterium]|nr:hypothetical protein [bacterium]
MAAKKNKKQTKLNHKQFFGLLLFCLTMLIYCTCYMLQNGGITYESVTGAFEDVIPYCCLIGFFGFIIGSILDKPNKNKDKENNDMINKFIQDASAQAAQAAHEAKMAANSQPSALSEDLNIKIDTEVDI